MSVRTILSIALMATSLHAAETLNRGLVAVVNRDGKPYIGWRLLKTDAPNTAFNVYRQNGNARPVRISRTPIFNEHEFRRYRGACESGELVVRAPGRSRT